MTLYSIKLIMIIAMLGGDSHVERETAYHQLMNSEFAYEEVRYHYYEYDVAVNPEVKLRLKEILWHLYQREFDSLHTEYYSDAINYKTLKEAFELDLKVNEIKEDSK